MFIISVSLSSSMVNKKFMTTSEEAPKTGA